MTRHELPIVSGSNEDGMRHAAGAAGTARLLEKTAAWLPLLTLPTFAAVAAADAPRWMLMWAVVLSAYLGFKWLSFAESAVTGSSSLDRSLGYLLLWPGMDAQAFFRPWPRPARPARSEWLVAVAKTMLGLSLIYIVPPHFATRPLLAGWIAMAGIALVLHFGLFHIASLCWRWAGVDAKPIMNAPLMASSLSDFWGRRWNLAFRDLAHAHVFHPLVGRIGKIGAMLAVFLVSGLIHDAVISGPAGAGFGLPTLYFAVQAAGFFVERTKTGRRFGLARGLSGRLFCAAVTILPAGILFHPAFVRVVVVPMLVAIGAL